MELSWGSLFLFLVFYVILPMLDVVSDTLTANEFHASGDRMFRDSTVVMIHLPAVAELMMYIVSLTTSVPERKPFKSALGSCLRLLPVIQQLW